MKQAFQDLKDFHEKFHLEYNGGPRLLSPEQLLHRLKFNIEEIGEFCKSDTIEKQVDGLIDQIYVVLGTLYLMGIDAPEAWKRVHQSNMAKVLLSSTKTVTGREAKFDGVMKPPGWKAPDLRDLCVPVDRCPRTGFPADGRAV